MNGCVPTAASPTPRNTELKCVAVAASGGRDSTALLHCTRQAAAALGVQVLALHVHHGLHPDADLWWAHVQRQSQRWGVGFIGHRLTTQPAAGDSVEAWARHERYAALHAMAEAAGCDLVLLAHHRRDQAETWLLQALRGAGPLGLSSMASQTRDDGVSWARPWLDMPREAIEAYVRRHRLSHIEDGSNDDLRFARNCLRAQLWPPLLQAFPNAEVTLCAAATRAQEAAALAAEVASQDLPTIQSGADLHIAQWLQLPPARRLNALRAWLSKTFGRGPPQHLVDRLCRELPTCRTGQWDAPDALLRVYRGLLIATAATTQPAVVGGVVSLDLSQPGRCSVPGWPGHFITAPVNTGGITRALLTHVLAQPRLGGEQFQLTRRGTPRSLKKQYQARGVPAWQRDGPLLFSPAGALLFAPGLGVNASAQAAPGDPQLSVSWRADG
jgi:tRNA(Ile)-lysidine synthase